MNEGEDMRKALIGVAALSAAGCLSFDSGIPTPEVVQNAINRQFIGRPIQEAVAFYGMPDGRMKMKGHDVYVWRMRTSMDFNRPQTVTTTGRIGASWNPNAIPYTETSTVNATERLDLQCVLSIGTEIERPEIIDGTAINGQMGACQHFMP